MTVTPAEAAEQLRNMSARFMQQVNSHGWNANQPYSTGITWQGPPLSPTEIVEWWNKFADRVGALADDDMTAELQAFLDQIPARVGAFEPTVANMSSDHGAPFRALIMLKDWIEDELPRAPLQVDWEDIKESGLVPRDLMKRLKSVNARLTELESQTSDLGGKVDRINDAHDAALELPTEMQELRDAKTEIHAAAGETKKMEGQAAAYLTEVTSLLEKIRRQDGEAAAIIAKCEQAFGIATTVGLAGSFTSRARWITVAAWVWVASLVGALGAGFWIGKSRFEELQTILTANPSPMVVGVSAAMAILGIGAPVWFAWIATKQIGQNFRLAEDYGFKATVARAYEGYRKEAATLSEDFASRLFESALDRLEEAPIRLVDSAIHGSPLQEFLHHPSIRDVLSTAPGLKDDIVTFIKSKLGAAAVGASAAATLLPNSSRAEAAE